MVGTKAGGLKASKTNKERHGDDFYKRIGTIGGRSGNTGGFYNNPELARKAGAKGGAKSVRGESVKTKQLLAENEELINEMLANGSSVKKISQITGVPTCALYKRVKKSMEA